MKNILIIEENPVTVDIYKIIFKKYLKEKVKIEVVTSAQKGLDRVTKNGFDLLIVDFNLKDEEINGLDIARLAYPLGKPIVLATGHKIMPRLTLYFKYWDMISNVKILNKPFKGRKIIDCINRLLDEETVSLEEMYQRIMGCH